MATSGAISLDQLYGRLPEASADALRHTLDVARGRGTDVFLAGGAVRDLLLDADDHLDLDLVVEDDALSLAEAVGDALAARAVTHERFGTAVVRGEGFRIDLARARSERYERPGALPTVSPATLTDDLGRRDFTINAMALRLSGVSTGELIDPHGGRDDLRRGIVRALHERSFQDDATRILRALRYAGRLDFRIEAKTEAWLRRDLPYFDTISGARLRREFERIAAEGRALDIVRLTRDYRALSAAHPALDAPDRIDDAVARLQDIAPSHRDSVLFCLLLADAARDDAEGAIARLALTGRQADAVRGLVALRADENKIARPSLRPSEAVRLLSPHPVTAIEAFAFFVREPLAVERARAYLDTWRYVRPRLNGRDIEALGVPHGPQVGAALEALRTARLDGRVESRDDEVALLREQGFVERALAEAHGG
ncbi:MAG: hypothetical protein WBD55_05395 [Dehalococcoidia bacterium]